jgi:hypothetical protein
MTWWARTCYARTDQGRPVLATFLIRAIFSPEYRSTDSFAIIEE